MIRNVGSFDKTIRIIAGLVIIILGFRYESWWGLIGLVLLITGLLSICPVYRLLGISTWPNGKKVHKSKV